MANATASITYAAAWVPEPNGRGTWGILYSCIFTLTLCVWSAIHLNIPPRGEHWRRQWRRKTKWLLIAIFAPELGLYSAWQQYYLAHRFILELKNVCRKHHGEAPDPTTFWWEDTLQRVFACVNALLEWFKGSGKEDLDGEASPSPRLSLLQEVYRTWVRSRKERHREPPAVAVEMDEISLTYGFYVVMGGLTIDAKMLYDRRISQRPQDIRSDVPERHGKETQDGAGQQLGRHESSIPDEREQSFYVTLTTRGVLELAQILPWEEFRSKFFVDQQFISDKSKADSLAKVLVILQVSWTLLNSLSRLVLGYHTSVLEIHTLVHAGCAMIMYGLWWEKPLDIRDATVMEVPSFALESQSKLALMFMRSAGSAYRPYLNFEIPDRWIRGRFTSEPSRIFASGNEDSAWPSKTYGCEAGLTCLDLSVVRRLASRSLQATYAKDNDEQSSPSRDTQSPSPQPAQGSTKLGQLTSERISNYSQDDLEANIGLTNLNAEDGRKSSPAATTHRQPPEGIQTVQRISTGEMLSTGIGPMPLITTTRLKEHGFWEATRMWFRQSCPWLSDTVRKRRPETCTPVEVDTSIKDAVRLPFPVKLTLRDKLTRKTAIYHKVTFDLSEKDCLRWNLAARAFIAELEDSETSLGDLGFWPAAAETSGKGQPAEPGKGGQNSTEVDQDEESGSRADDECESSADLADPTLLCLQTQIREPGNEAFFDFSNFCDRSKNFDLDALRSFGAGGSGHAKSFFAIMVYVVVSLISGVYAGIHLALWNHDFPSRAEALTWRISATALGAPAVLLVLVTIGAQLSLVSFCVATADQWIGNSTTWRAIVAGVRRLVHAYRRAWGEFGESCEVTTWILTKSCVLALRAFIARIKRLEAKSKKSPARRAMWYIFCAIVGSPVWIIVAAALAVFAALCVVYYALLVAMVAGVPLYLFARVYIVVESFLSLRLVPVGVYEDVSWAQYLPHM